MARLTRGERRAAEIRLVGAAHEQLYREDALEGAAETALAAVRARAELMAGQRSERTGSEAMARTLFGGSAAPIEDLVDGVLHDVDRYGEAYTETLIRFLIDLSAVATIELARAHDVSPKRVVKTLATAFDD